MRIVKIASLLTTFAVSAAARISLAAQEMPPESWPGWRAHWFGFWWICPLMMLFMFLLFFFAIRSKGRGHRWWWMCGYPESRHSYGRDQDATLESALDILNKRYARGEIEKEEYEEKKATIGSSNT